MIPVLMTTGSGVGVGVGVTGVILLSELAPPPQPTNVNPNKTLDAIIDSLIFFIMSSLLVRLIGE